MGSPEFAVASLDAMLQAGFLVVAVVTAPDKPAGRGMKAQTTPVKQYALAHGLDILQPEKLKDPVFLKNLRAYSADLQVVVAFRMLPEQVWNMPGLGTINLHASLLPQYRGAAPINWAVMNGETRTGVTTFKMQHEIDTGNILMQESFPISEQETSGEVHDRMKVIGARVLVRTIEGLASGTLHEIPQKELGVEGEKRAPKIFKETCNIDWHKSTWTVYNQIRGLCPFPGAYTYLDGKMLKIFRAGKQMEKPTEKPGAYFSDGRTYLKFAATDGYLVIEELQIEGKKRMAVEDFLRGHKLGPTGADESKVLPP